MSLDFVVTVDKKITFNLLDSSLTSKLKNFTKNVFFEHLYSNCEEKDELKYEINLTLNDFLPIFNFISKGIKPLRGEVEEFETFFGYCQYFQEIELPILITKDSDQISKWSMKKDLLISSEKEKIVLQMYTMKDKELDDEKTDFSPIFESYTDDFFNNKLNEKTGLSLFKEIKTTDIGKFIFPILENIENKQHGPIDYVRKTKVYRSRQYFIHSKTFDTLPIHVALSNLKLRFESFPWVSEKGGRFFIAGGSVLKSIVLNSEQSSFRGNDVDIFLITRSEEEAVNMIHQLYIWINSTTKNCAMTRTKNSISFVTDRIVYQVILRLYHSMEQVLCGFDIDPCCIGFDGENYLTIPRGLLSIEKRGFPVINWRQSQSFAYRCKKYNLRGFDLYFPGVTEEEYDKAFNKKINNSSSMLLRIINNQGKNTGDYEDINLCGYNFSTICTKIRDQMRMGFAKSIDIFTEDISLIFDTSKSENPTTIIKRNQNNQIVHSKLVFIKEMCHGQITGSFKPTTEDWYKDVKW